MITEKLEVVLQEVSSVFASTSFASLDKAIEEIVLAEDIVGVGAGRVGLAVASFSKRLVHLGKKCNFITDVCLTRFSENSLMIVGSGSGETGSVVHSAQMAKENGGKIFLITSNPSSTLSKIADVSILLNCPNKVVPESLIKSIQPMTTLFEQSLTLFLDGLVLELMEKMGVSEIQMKKRHDVLE